MSPAEPSYYIRQRGRGEQGPFPAAKVREWARQGRVLPDMEFSTDGRAWVEGRRMVSIFPNDALAARRRETLKSSMRPSGRPLFRSILFGLLGLALLALAARLFDLAATDWWPIALRLPQLAGEARTIAAVASLAGAVSCLCACAVFARAAVRRSPEKEEEPQQADQ